MTHDPDDGPVPASPGVGLGPGLPEATGSRRMDWTAMPPEVTTRIGRLLGSPVAHASSQRGGFSEGLAARVRLENGKRAFIKAASSLMAPAVADFHRREIAVSERLPREVAAPRLLDAYDDGTWVVLVFEEIVGHLPAQPWQREELDRVLAAVTDMAEALTPSPVNEAILGKPRLGGWRTMADDPGSRPRPDQRGARPARRFSPADRRRGRAGRRSQHRGHDERVGPCLAALAARCSAVDIPATGRGGPVRSPG